MEKRIANSDRRPEAAALFDLDGVLVDSESRYTEFWDSMGKRFPTGYDDFSLRIKGTTLTNILNTYFPTELHEDIVEHLDRFEREMVYDIKPGVTELLERLAELSVPAVMVTSSNDRKMSQLWSQHPELRSYFKEIVTADMITRSKPDPEGYLLGARLADIDIRHCCVFEDSRQGVMAGRASGAYVIGIAGTLPADMLRPYADRVIDTLEGFDTDALVGLLNAK